MKKQSRFLTVNRLSLLSTQRIAGAVALFATVVLPLPSLLAQSFNYDIRGTNYDLQLAGTVNVRDLANKPPITHDPSVGPEMDRNPERELRPKIENTGRVISPVAPTRRIEANAIDGSLAVRGFTGLTHLDQRNAGGGNQFSVEPPDQALSVANGYVLEAVNSALNVYTPGGIQRLPRPLTLNEFFGLPPSIDRATGQFGVFVVDPVSLYDADTDRWFVAAFANLNDLEGSPLAKSRLYLAVSETSDPTGVFKIFTLNSTFTGDPDGAGSRFPDFPHMGADRYGLFISVNEFSLKGRGFIGTAIFAFSKQRLVSGTGSGGSHPGVTRISLPFQTGFEFTVFPATTPPGSDPFLGNNGTEFFVSSRFVRSTAQGLSVWALTNTKSLETDSPSLRLKRDRVATQTYNFPSQSVRQKEGFRPLGELLQPKGDLPTISPGDFRVLSVVYSAGQLWATLGTEVTDQNGDQQMGAAYFAFSPKIANGNLNASIITQGIVSDTGASLLRPAVALNAQLQGGMVFTLVGPNDYPSSAFVPIDGTSVGAIRMSRRGVLPEDGFTGYPAIVGGNGVARWGDYSAAAVDTDGSIWMATEYITDLPRTTFANWDTYITRYRP